MAEREEIRARFRAYALAMMTLAPLAGAGCSLLVSTDGLSTAAAPLGEAGLPAEASTRETGTTPDAAADAPSLPYCASLSPQPKFCVDFDTGSLADFGPTVGLVTLDSSLSKSPSRSLACEVPTDAATRGALFGHPFNATPMSYELSFDTHVDAYDPTHDVEMMTVTLQSGTDKSCRTDVSIRDGLWTVDESCESGGTQTFGVSHKSALAMQLGRWTHIEASVSLAPARTYSLAVDGQVLFSALPLGADLTTGNLALQVGIVYAQINATTAKLNFDNVRFDYR